MNDAVTDADQAIRSKAAFDPLEHLLERIVRGRAFAPPPIFKRGAGAILDDQMRLVAFVLQQALRGELRATLVIQIEEPELDAGGAGVQR